MSRFPFPRYPNGWFQIAYADELAGLRGVFGRSKRGDVIGVTALGMRNEVFGWLEAAGAKRLTPADVRRLVKRAAS